MEPARKRQKQRETLQDLTMAEKRERNELAEMETRQVAVLGRARHTLLLLGAMREAHRAAMRAAYEDSVEAARRIINTAGRKWLGWLQRNRIRARMVTDYTAKTTLTYMAAVWATGIPEHIMGQFVEDHRQGMATAWKKLKRMSKKRKIPVYEGAEEVDRSAIAAWQRRVRPKGM